jgi:hypothetical protein
MRAELTPSPCARLPVEIVSTRMKTDTRSLTFSRSASWHCQITRTRQPCARSLASTERSVAYSSSWKPEVETGIGNRAHDTRCAGARSSVTNTTLLRLRNTRSDDPVLRDRGACSDSPFRKPAVGR